MSNVIHEKDRFSLIFIGYSSCPDVCPRTLDIMSRVIDSIKATNMNYYFVSIDSGDNQKNVDDFAKNFNPKIKGVSLNARSVDFFTEWIETDFKKTDDNFFHSSSIYLIDDSGVLVGEFLVPRNVMKISRHISSILSKR